MSPRSSLPTPQPLRASSRTKLLDQTLAAIPGASWWGQTGLNGDRKSDPTKGLGDVFTDAPSSGNLPGTMTQPAGHQALRDPTLRVGLLRSIVIAGQRVDGAGARALALEAGCEEVRSLLATGNLVFRSGLAPAELEPALEAACAERYGRATEIVVKTASQWQRLMNANPFRAECDLAPARVLVWAMRTPLPDAGLDQLRRRAGSDERVERTPEGDLYCWFGESEISRSKLPSGFGLKALGAVGTNRNWNTARRITAALLAVDGAG